MENSSYKSEAQEAYKKFIKSSKGILGLNLKKRENLKSFSEIQKLGELWNIPVFDAGEAGKLDETSGHGPWPEGLMSFAGFLKKL